MNIFIFVFGSEVDIRVTLRYLEFLICGHISMEDKPGNAKFLFGKPSLGRFNSANIPYCSEGLGYKRFI